MNMIRHYDCDPKIELDAVVVKAAFQNKRTHTVGENPPVVGTECYEVLFVITLKMRKLSPIESLRHAYFMWGQPPSAVQRSEAPLFGSLIGSVGRNGSRG
jgi:hypothetical protein